MVVIGTRFIGFLSTEMGCTRENILRSFVVDPVTEQSKAVTCGKLYPRKHETVFLNISNMSEMSLLPGAVVM
jgi:hypothetical protein